MKLSDLHPFFEQRPLLGELKVADYIKGHLLVVVVPNEFMKSYFSESVARVKELLQVPEVKIVVESATEQAVSTAAEPEEKEVISRWGVLMGDPLEHEYSPKNFIVSGINARAVEMVSEVSSERSASLVVYGPPGVGKTHLLQATAWRLLANGTDVLHFKAKSLAVLIRNAFSSRQTDKLEAEFLKARALLIDDFQMFSSKKLSGIRDFLFVLIDAFLTAGGVVISTSDVKPDISGWRGIEERIRQRLTLRGSVLIRRPDCEFACMFVKTRLASNGVSVPEEALTALHGCEFSNVRELEALVWLIRHYLKKGLRIEEAVATAVAETDTVVSDRSEISDMWKSIVNRLLPPMEADRLLAGEMPRGRYRTTARALRSFFVSEMVRRGWKKADIARAFKVSTTAVNKWIAKKDEYARAMPHLETAVAGLLKESEKVKGG